ncbi:MAG: ureidoglycolate lyase [Burkholderiales bacterium]|nr:ureidoglycolate lyase [Burkholderiales bacterium]
MPARTIRAALLTAAAFAPFGRVLEAGGHASTANQGRAERFDTALDLATHDARASRLHSAVYRIAQSSLPFTVTVIERHPLSPQLFYPNSGAGFLVCACPVRTDGEPDLSALQAFIGTRAQGIVWNAGVWHSPLAALGENADFLMLQWQCGGPLDCEERHLPVAISVAGPAARDA